METLKKYLPVLLIFFSCSNNKPKEKISQVKIIDIQPTFVLSKLNDSTFLSNNIGAVRKINDTYIISDVGSQKIYILNEHLKLIQTISSYGKGPKEYINPTGMCLWNSKLFILSSGTSTLKVYDFNMEKGEWNHHNNISFTSQDYGYRNSMFVNDSTIYQTSVGDDILQKSDFDNNILEEFGRFEIDNISRKFMHIIRGEDFYYLIGISEPVIFKYDYNDSLINKKQYYDHLVFKNSLEQQHKIYRERSQNTTAIMTSDAFVLNDKLFILFWDRNKNIIKSKIIVIDKNDLGITHLLELPTRPHVSFCPSIDSNHIITYNSNKTTLEKYNIKALFD